MKELAQHLQALGGIQLSAAQYRDFQLYEQSLIEWNKRFNLTAIRIQNNPNQAFPIAQLPARDGQLIHGAWSMSDRAPGFRYSIKLPARKSNLPGRVRGEKGRFLPAYRQGA
jgi:hypothetical protein